MENAYHVPVLPEESIEALDIKPDGTYVDVTFGAGGHSKRILEKLSEKGRLFGFDQDEDARQNLKEDERFVFVKSDFRYLKRFLRLHGVKEVDGLLADLGVSSHQFDIPERGFSFRFDAKLDMRMNVESGVAASDVLSKYSAAELQKMFSEYGEVRNARTLAEAIVEKRRDKPIETTFELNDLLDAVGKGPKNKYYAQVYQAIRIEVNDEMSALKEMLKDAEQLMKPGARIAVISYHSIEDRLVKYFLKTGNFEGELVKDDFGNIKRPFRLVNKKVIVPNAEEIRRNPRARSAKLRVGERAVDD